MTWAVVWSQWLLGVSYAKGNGTHGLFVHVGPLVVGRWFGEPKRYKWTKVIKGEDIVGL
jgi:hypothetical protein